MECSPIPEMSYRKFSDRFHEKAVAARVPVNGTLEMTYRCNLNCVHCYCNLTLDDTNACEQELTTQEIVDLIDQIADRGCLWLLITGGECLLRKDFFDIWTYAKKRGLLLTLFTNGTLITPEVADFLKEWPPFSVEITLYGATSYTYESVTRMPGSYARCKRGIELLLDRNIPLRLKTMVLTLNRHELGDMQRYAQGLGVEFRFDAMVNSRLDCGKDPCQFRIDPSEVVRLDMEDEKRLKAWKEFCRKFLRADKTEGLFVCGAGVTTFNINPVGRLQVCGMVSEPYWDLRNGSFSEGWEELLPTVREQKPTEAYICNDCELYSLCGQCPGWAMTENNNRESPVEYLCQITHERAKALEVEGSTLP
ncbi:MAG: radical SAM protein [Pseudomonadota bacterium]